MTPAELQQGFDAIYEDLYMCVLPSYCNAWVIDALTHVASSANSVTCWRCMYVTTWAIIS